MTEPTPTKNTVKANPRSANEKHQRGGMGHGPMQGLGSSRRRSTSARPASGCWA